MKPLLSIGMIFKNEIRCLERCMKSLAPLREAIPCELVMADTGSDDGSRAVAEKYADILFDFHWIDDFSAARNAVIDRCSGEWFLTVDADEWLDGDISELVGFLSDPGRWDYPFCGVFVRNYATPELDGEYADFLAVRMARLSTGERYHGAIHEAWAYDGTVRGLGKTILHHDGYVKVTTEKGREKRRRNMELLRKKLEEEPDQLKVMLQCVESSNGDPAYEGYIRQALAGVERKLFQWELFGPAIFRYAVIWAAAQDLPELEKWAAQAMEQFPDSPFTNIDMAYALFIYYAERRDYEKAIPVGERYLDSARRYHAGDNRVALLVSTIAMATPSREDGARAILADAYLHMDQFQKAKDTLLEIDCARMYPEAVKNYIGTMMNLHAQGGMDMTAALVEFWKKTQRPEPKREQGEACRRAMAAAAEAAFSKAYRTAEDENGFGHAYTLFLPLAGQCETGNAARILAAESEDELAAVLPAVEDWELLPASALVRAIAAGAAFPLPEKPLNLEVMDTLAARIAQEPEQLFSILRKAAAGTETPQSLAWARGLALAAVQTCRWTDEAYGMELARIFAEVEGKFLPVCYAPDVLQEGNLFLLPPLHRFGWYCAQAFAALDERDTITYTRRLRGGLAACEAMKPMVEFLIEHTPALQAEKPNAELLVLAERVRAMLAAYPADDPAVAALKASPAYQKVAHLIEGDRK